MAQPQTVNTMAKVDPVWTRIREEAEAIVRSEPASRVLLVCVELCSLHFQASDRPDQIVANALFADGAAAAVIAAAAVPRRLRIAARRRAVRVRRSGRVGALVNAPLLSTPESRTTRL